MHTSPYAQAAPSVTETLNITAISREHIEDWIVESLAEYAGLDVQDIDVTLPCTAYGLDSLTSVTLVGDLEVWLNVSLSPTLFWDMLSIDHLVQHLVDALTVTPEALVCADEGYQEWPAGLELAPEMARALLGQLDQLSDQDVEALLCELAA